MATGGVRDFDHSFSVNSSIPQVERGIATKGSEIEIIGLGPTRKTTLTGIGEIFFPEACFGAHSPQSCRDVPQGTRSGTCLRWDYDHPG